MIELKTVKVPLELNFAVAIRYDLTRNNREVYTSCALYTVKTKVLK